MALKNSHEYAWQLFLYLNLPAVAGKAGVPDGTKKFGVTDTALVWESWALSSGDDFSETYPKDGARPVNWDALPRTGPRRLILETSKKREAFLETIRRQMPASLAKFVPLDASAQEVRANRLTYEFIIKNEMYHMGGLEALLDKARRTGNRQLISDGGEDISFACQLPAATERVLDWFHIGPQKHLGGSGNVEQIDALVHRYDDHAAQSLFFSWPSRPRPSVTPQRRRSQRR